MIQIYYCTVQTISHFTELFIGKENCIYKWTWAEELYYFIFIGFLLKQMKQYINITDNY